MEMRYKLERALQGAKATISEVSQAFARDFGLTTADSSGNTIPMMRR